MKNGLRYLKDRGYHFFGMLADKASVKTKIMGIVLGLVLLLGLGVTLQIQFSLPRALNEQLEKRAISIARDVAARSTDLVLTNNVFALYELARDTAKNNEDVRYVLILDRAGNVLAHTFAGGVPAGLAKANSAAPADRYRLEIFNSEEGVVRDVAVPIFEGRAGTARVGLLEHSTQKVMVATTERLLLATLVVSIIGIFAAYFLTMVLTRPLFELVEVTRAVASGNLRRKANVSARDEIGQLATAFNGMVDHLRETDVENAHLCEELKQKEAIRAHLLEKLITAQEEERKRLARELHDETGQSLTSLMVGLKVLGSAGTPEEVRRQVAGLREVVAGTLEGVRHLALELRPSLLDDLGLIAALERYVREYGQKYGLEADLQVGGFEGRRLPPEVEITLYRIVQEALTNIARHAGARNVSVLVEHKGNAVTAIVEDDGKGFDVAAILGSPLDEKKLGLYGMRERAALLGGTLTLESREKMGTTVFVTLPLEETGVA
ncbi:MAG: HAMP domain-containing protein [Firmicutes bacterium]|nr:HAMP domain-containing protein [Bacillota bacterium]